MKKSDLFLTKTAIIIFLLSFVCAIPFVLNAQSTFNLNSISVPEKYSMSSGLVPTSLLTNTTSDDLNVRETNVLRASRWVGAVAGSFMGVAQIYWRATGVSGPRGPMWKNVLTGIPSSIIGSYVGIKMTEWSAKQIMNGSPKPGKAVFKGMLYGAIDGTVTLAAALAPLLIIGHYADTIDFNVSNEMIVFKLLGSAVAGGLVYGGTFGAVVGGVSA